MLKKAYFPINYARTFIFINTPIRYGRAWIFPTGLEDALWHMFRQASYNTAQVATPEQAWKFPVKSGYSPEYLIFENFKLKKSLREIETFEEEVMQ